MYSLSVLTYRYSIAALDLKAKQLAELNVCWNSVYRRLFRYHKWESVRGCIEGLGMLDFFYMCVYWPEPNTNEALLRVGIM